MRLVRAKFLFACRNGAAQAASAVRESFTKRERDRERDGRARNPTAKTPKAEINDTEG